MLRLWSALVLWILLAALLGAADRRITEWRAMPAAEISPRQWQILGLQLVRPNAAVDRPSLLDSAASWLRRAVDRVSYAWWGFTRDLYAKINDLVLPSPSSFRSPFGNSGATEPLAAIIPEPPTISHRHELKAKLYLVVDQVIKAFNAANLGHYRRGCLSAADEELVSLRKIMKRELEAAVCGANEVDHEFCKLYNVDEDIVVDMVFSMMNVNQVNIVVKRVSQNRNCHSEFKTGNWQKKARSLGHMFHETNKHATVTVNHPEDSYRHAAALSRLAEGRLSLICHTTRCPDMHQACHLRNRHPNIFAALFASTFRPWEIAAGDTVAPRRLVRYRRAMLFPQMPELGIQVFRDSTTVVTLVTFGTVSVDVPVDSAVSAIDDVKRQTDDVKEQIGEQGLIRTNAQSSGGAAAI